MTSHLQPPRWNVSNIFPGLDSQELTQAMAQANEQVQSLAALIQALPADPTQTPSATLAEAAGQVIEKANATFELTGTIQAYLYAFVSTDSFNQQAMRLTSQFEKTQVAGQNAMTQFALWVRALGERLEEIIALNPTLESHRFFLQETYRQSRYLMPPEMEALATELSLSGSNAWSKLQGTVTSQKTVEFELDGKVQTLPMPALINLHSHPDESVRRRAYEAEMEAWKSIEAPLAAAMNGVKGWAITLNKRRGREDALHGAIDAARIDRPTLEAMLSAMANSFPIFRRYFKAKAARLGKEKLAWWDLFAPMGKTDRTYTFEDARSFILTNFSQFSPDLAAFARRAFDQSWIDAEQRPGKRGGAFCMAIPGVKESRVLCNFDGSLDQVSTIAHELGHAYHNECLFRAGKTILQSELPMTLAETASILCETIVVDAALNQAASPQEELSILETSLISDSQVIVDIYSRYLFEKEVFERREKAELSPDELCEIMERAQKATYGDGLDERYLHKYMWTWKPHYYFTDLSFYNFPYAFGLLFGIGLYAIYRQRGANFIPDYQNLLASTGEASAADLAKRFGIDIRQRSFWENSLAIIGERIERYIAIK